MENEAIIRLSVFLGLFIILALTEAYFPRRNRAQSRKARWVTNWGFTLLNALTLRLLAFALPLLAVGAAVDANHAGLGLFNIVHMPTWIKILLTILMLDLAIWFQHLITHKIPFLWRLHRVHHADVDVDVTTAIRFHPLEIALSMVFKIGLIYIIGAPILAVILFEIILNGTAMFNHANIKLPQKVDAILRKVIVTPDMHRIHHSIHRHEHDSNYGFSLSIWDHLFGTYIEKAALDHETMPTGLHWQDDRPSKLSWSLLLPFRKK